jgi:hypothetical protein
LRGPAYLIVAGQEAEEAGVKSVETLELAL